jgi:hypothetical protein
MVSETIQKMGKNKNIQEKKEHKVQAKKKRPKTYVHNLKNKKGPLEKKDKPHLG